MTFYAMEEMAEDDLDLGDVEQAILNGRVVRREKDDPRGTKYIVEGFAADGEPQIGLVGRFIDSGRYLIITVYEVSKEQ
jgi:hypothetical protein